MYQELPGACCCHICELQLFPMEVIELEKLPGLKQGNKWKVSEEQEDTIHEDLVEWHEDELLDKIYLGTDSISAQIVLGDDVIDKLVSCGEHIEMQAKMQRHVRWAISFDENTGYSTTYGDMPLAKLQSIYTKLDDTAAAEDANLAELHAMLEEVDPINFYANSIQSLTRHAEILTGEIDTGGSSSREQASIRGTGHQQVRGGG